MSSRDHRLRRAAAVVALAGLLTALLAVAGPAPSAAAAGTEARGDRYERALVGQVSQMRSAKGLRPVRVVPCVDVVAEDRATRMRRTRQLPRAGDRLLRECRHSLRLDATARGRYRPATLVKDWMEGPAARSVLLAPRTRWVGAG